MPHYILIVLFLMIVFSLLTPALEPLLIGAIEGIMMGDVINIFAAQEAWIAALQIGGFILVISAALIPLKHFITKEKPNMGKIVQDYKQLGMYVFLALGSLLALQVMLQLSHALTSVTINEIVLPNVDGDSIYTYEYWDAEVMEQENFIEMYLEIQRAEAELIINMLVLNGIYGLGLLFQFFVLGVRQVLVLIAVMALPLGIILKTIPYRLFGGIGDTLIRLSIIAVFLPLFQALMLLPGALPLEAMQVTILELQIVEAILPIVIASISWNLVKQAGAGQVNSGMGPARAPQNKARNWGRNMQRVRRPHKRKGGD